MARSQLTRTTWEVVVAAHHVPPRWDVPERRFTLGGTELFAKLQALGWAQADAGVPPWRPFRRLGWAHVAAVRVDV